MIKKGLTSNQLKLIAMVTMTLDHMGLLLFPGALWLRAVGRLAFPIYAYMIAEGCIHTKSMPRYLGTMAAMAAVCQVVTYIATGSLYQCILVTFSLSIGLVWLILWARQLPGLIRWLLCAGGVAAVFFVTELLPLQLEATDFAVDYGFFGTVLPVVLVFAGTKYQKLLLTAVLLTALAFVGMPVQWFALLSLPLLALYNGQRGKLRLKWVFYLYYPIHLAVLHIVATFLF